MTVVIGVRVPKRLKEELERLGINVGDEVRVFLERRVREERVKRVLKELETAHQKIGQIPGDHSGKIVRELREAR